MGIFFGGFSREREVSFASGRTVYDNLDRTLFTPVPIFVDSLGRWIILEWQYLYRGSIRDFYPPPHLLTAHRESTGYNDLYIESFAQHPDLLHQAGQVGEPIHPHEIASRIDFGFIALHGMGGEDGSLQGILAWYGVPYSGCGIRASSEGIDKAWQKQFFKANGWKDVQHCTITREEWLESGAKCVSRVTQQVPRPWIVKPAKEGSSIGVGVARTQEELQARISAAFFMHTLTATHWHGLSREEKKANIAALTSLKDGIGMPVMVAGEKIYHPAALLEKIEQHIGRKDGSLRLEGCLSENVVLVEQMIDGREFSCIVIENARGQPTALPPTEILKEQAYYDYRAKYLPGVTRKKTPMDIPHAVAQRIRERCETLYKQLGLEVYARIDGFLTKDGDIYLNDPNTTSGMQLSSFFFHQAALAGIYPHVLLRHIIVGSLLAEGRRNKRPHTANELLRRIEPKLSIRKIERNKIKLGIITGGTSSEKHIAIETARNVYEKLASSAKYSPVAFLLVPEKNGYFCHELPIALLLKDNATDIEEQIKGPQGHRALVEAVRQDVTALGSQAARSQGGRLSWRALSERVDAVFIAMHGRPGEDGTLQGLLEQQCIPYNGSDEKTAALAIDKFATNQKLQAHGLQTPTQMLVRQADYVNSPSACLQTIEHNFSYPVVLKPQDDGCSTGVRKIAGREALIKGLKAHFTTQRTTDNPLNSHCLVESFICAATGEMCKEITVGLTTHHKEHGVSYEVFAPSEVIKMGNVLSIEEKFLTGEDKNITPAVFSTQEKTNRLIHQKVRSTAEKVAKILQIEGYARIDAFVSSRNGITDVTVVEVNTLPGMTASTCLFHQAALAGYTPYALLDHIITFGVQRRAYREKVRKK